VVAAPVESAATIESAATANTSPPGPPALTAAQWAALDVPAPGTDAVLPLLALRCGGCHSATPTLMAAAPKGVVYDTAADAERHAAQILRQVVQLKVMPPGNMTGLTDAERAALGRWAAARAADAR
jgi:uncharacterized membrane protein